MSPPDLLQEKICRALEAGRLDDVAAVISAVIERASKDLPGGDPGHQQEIERLAAWLSASRCVGEVSIREGVLKTHPPQKVLLVYPGPHDKWAPLTLKLQLGRQLRVHSIEAVGHCA